MRRRLSRTIAVLLLILIVAVAITPVRRGVLQALGRHLAATDPPQPADLLTLDVESGPAGVLRVSDLSREQPAAAVAVLAPRTTLVDAELRRRGVVLPDLTIQTLEQLGVAANRMTKIEAGEGGTTETTAALAEWARAHPGRRVLVVVGPSHGRRYRRALRRVWPERQPPPVVVATTYALFHADDWWQSRTTLREGLVELEKLALDYVAHPW